MKRNLSLLLAVICCLSLILSACSKSKENKPDAVSTATETGGAATPSQSGEPTGTAAGEKLTWDSPELSWKKDTSPVTLDIFLDYSWWPMDSWGQDEVSKEITRRTGVTLDVTKATNENQLQVMLASGSLPCFVYTANTNFDKNFQNPNVSYTYDELISKYAPELADLLDPVQVFLNTADDGHYYAIRSHYINDEEWADPRNVPGPGVTAFHFRQDIYEALGQPPMDTIDDIVNVFRMVKEQYPDMIPFIPFWNPFQQYMGYTTSPKLSGDKVIMGISEPGFVEYYKLMNKLYKEELVPKESLSYKYEQFLQVVRSGKVFAAGYNGAFSDEQNKFFDTNQITGKWTPLNTPPKFNGETKMNIVLPSGGWSNLYITKSCKNPERAIKYFEFLKSPEGDTLAQWGIENEHYTLTADGFVDRPESFLSKSIQEAGVGPNYGLWNFGASGLREGILNASIAISDPQYAAIVDLLKTLKPYYSQDPILNFANPKGGSDEAVISTKIAQIVTQTESKLIMASSDAEVETVFNKMMDDINKAGLPKLETYMTNAYSDAKARYAEFLKNNGSA